MTFHPHIEPFTTRFISIQEGGQQPRVFQATSFWGCGRLVYFHRPVAPGVYEAELWVTALFIPILPLAIWVIHPRGMRVWKGEWTTWEVFYSDFLEGRPLTLTRLPLMFGRAFFWLAALVGPLAVGILICESTRAHGARPGQPELIWLFGSVVWGLAISHRWRRRRDAIYKGIEQRQARGEAVYPDDGTSR